MKINWKRSIIIYLIIALAAITFFTVILPGIASTAIFTFVFTWNEYLMALMLTSFNTVTVPVTIAKFVMPYAILWGDLSAAVVIQVVPMLIVVFLLQRHIVRGMSLGAVK